MRFRKGLWVRIELDDHAEDSDAPIRCVCYGQVAEATRK